MSEPERYAKDAFGALPPDLTMVARVRSPEWLYTYLKTFYVDSSRPYGVNNLVFKDVGMPHVLMDLQGEQECHPAWAVAANGGVKRDIITGENREDEHSECGRVEVIDGTGSMSEEEYDQAMVDLTNFLTYSADPVVVKRERIGGYVLLFISVFFVFAYLLNREYWKDVH